MLVESSLFPHTKTRKKFISEYTHKQFSKYSPHYRLNSILEFSSVCTFKDRLCGLVVRVSGYRYRGPGFDPRRYQIF